MSDPEYRRIVLKVSGEALSGSQGYGLDADVLSHLATELRGVLDLGVQVALVVGGGNIFRGVSGAARGMDRAQADTMGMLATVINALALQDSFERAGMPSRVQSALTMPQACEPYIRRRAQRHLDKERVLIFAAGTGNPYFSTDTAAALRAMELKADVLIKATKVDGVYDKDPVEHPDANRYSSLTYHQVLADELHVMDATAVALCMENQLPIVVFDLSAKGKLLRLIQGDKVGTKIEGGSRAG